MVVFEPWDILPEESGPSRDRKSTSKIDTQKTNRRFRLGRSISSVKSRNSINSNMSSNKRQRYPSNNSAGSDPVIENSKKPNPVSKKKSSSVQSRNNRKCSGRQRNPSNNSNKSTKRSARSSSDRQRNSSNNSFYGANRHNSSITTRNVSDDFKHGNSSLQRTHRKR